MSMKIVITGSTSGIGKALALHYARPNRTIGIIGRRQERLATIADQCRQQGADIIPAPIDVRDEYAMQTYAKQFIKHAHGIDVVIANAGIGASDDLLSGNARALTAPFKVNVIGLLNTIAPFIPPMQRQQHGQIVAIASVAGFRALPGSTTYAATKMAVRTLMEGYGWALRQHGITTTTINPGFVVSEMTAKHSFTMPFLMPADVAARRIAGAIARKRHVYTFPWPMAVIARFLSLMPGSIIARKHPRP